MSKHRAEPVTPVPHPATATELTSLVDATVLITGASSGIGAATALRLGAQGATVALLARRKEKLDELVEQINGLGGRALAVEVDVTDADGVHAAVQGVAERTGGIDVLINNAGTAVFGPVEEGALDDWHAMVDININGVLHCVHAALPHLLKAASGARGLADVITVSSVAGRISRANNPVYSATKHAVNAFSEALRQSVTTRYVRVGLVEPGMVTTELTQRDSPLGTEFEWLHPDDIADAVEFMLTRPRRATVNELLIRPTAQER